ncbi:hypothetical protein E2C01_051625 [Portunus trituberculatus]|uniref:Uncharacterized protein n=1 Tax=Portunus trituberculatus TaxID=210409 RepID=A0A5B7GBI7_PORTR|nr:hypothetical protein [Portunus trituberculatus]
MNVKLRRRVYEAAAGVVMMYSAESLAIRGKEERLLEMKEAARLLRRVSGTLRLTTLREL